MRFFTATLASWLSPPALPADGVSFAASGRNGTSRNGPELPRVQDRPRADRRLDRGAQPTEGAQRSLLPDPVENKAGALQAASFTIRVIRPDSTDTKVYTFAADIPAGSHLFEIGLTGTDWVWPRTMPVAWEVELHAADGSLLAQKASFLWRSPRP